MILVVDDDPEVLELIGDVLGQIGHEIQTTTSPLEALERIGQRRYELIVSDVNMPGLDGLGLYRAAVDRAPALARRFILVTGSSLTPEVREFIHRTGLPILSKPFSVQKLREVAEQILGV
jgi:CheY-like chemotaxis protein